MALSLSASFDLLFSDISLPLNTPDQRWLLWLTLGVVSAIGGVFLGLIAVPLASDHWPQGGYFIVAGTALLLLIFFVTVFVTACSDPGIVPRPDPHDLPAAHDAIDDDMIDRPPLLLIQGTPYRLRYCITCRILRPPRTSHCRIMDRCIVRYDESLSTERILSMLEAKL